MIGPEGFCGIPIVMGGRSQRYASTVQMAGSLEKLAIHVLDEKNGKTPLSDVMRGYALIQLGQITPSAICNRFHTLTQRLCRWLLSAADRVRTDKLELTLGISLSNDRSASIGLGRSDRAVAKKRAHKLQARMRCAGPACRDRASDVRMLWRGETGDRRIPQRPSLSSQQGPQLIRPSGPMKEREPTYGPVHRLGRLREGWLVGKGSRESGEVTYI
jgi:hypothetical protein